MTAPPSPAGAEVFDQLFDNVICCGADGVIRYVNPQTCRVFGRSKQDLVGQRAAALFPEVKDDAFHPAFERVARSGVAEQVETLASRLNRWYRTQLYRSGDCIWAIGRDITDERRATARLETLANASRVFSEAANDPGTVFESIVRHVAEVIHDLCSIRLLSADGARFEAPIASWDVDPRFRALLRQVSAVDSGAAVGPELRESMRPIVLADMNPADIAARIAPPSHRAIAEELGIHSAIIVPLRAQGRLLGALSVCRRRAGTNALYGASDLKLLEELSDRAALVVDQWRAFRLVEEARRRLVVIADALPVLVSLVDRNERYQFVNATYEQWFGLDRAQIEGRTLAEVLGAGGYAAVEPHVRAALSGRVVTYETRVPYRSGERHIRATNTPYLVNGVVEGYVALVQDISERVRHEAALESAIATRDEFLSVASHELRTPLTTLDLQLDGLLRSFSGAEAGAPADKVLRKVQMAARQTDRLTTLVDGLFDVSRISKGALSLDVEEFDLAALVRDIVERFDEDAARVGSSIKLVLPGPVLGHWDRGRLDQALTNLLSNAIKYGPGKPIEVVLAADADRVRLAVRDEGIGISPEDLDRIFNRFERAVSVANYGGLGLGLYIARQIVATHGGTIVAESAPGRGATFTMLLPRAVPLVVPTPGAAAITSPLSS